MEVDTTAGWRVERIRDRHDDAVTACAFSPVRDSERAATVSADGTARVWNTRWGTCLATLRGHSAAVEGAVFAHDASRLFTASADATLREWRAEPPYRCLGVVAGHYGAVHGVALATSGRHLFSVSEDRTLRAWLRARLEAAPAPGAPAARVGSRAYSQDTAAGRTEWYQWVQVPWEVVGIAIFILAVAAVAAGCRHRVAPVGAGAAEDFGSGRSKGLSLCPTCSFRDGCHRRRWGRVSVPSQTVEPGVGVGGCNLEVSAAILPTAADVARVWGICIERRAEGVN